MKGSALLAIIGKGKKPMDKSMVTDPEDTSSGEQDDAQAKQDADQAAKDFVANPSGKTFDALMTLCQKCDYSSEEDSE